MRAQSELWDYFTTNGQVNDNFLSFNIKLFTDDIVINFSEMKKKNEMKEKTEDQIEVPQSFSSHSSYSRCTNLDLTMHCPGCYRYLRIHTCRTIV